jgi:hypothetical protein
VNTGCELGHETHDTIEVPTIQGLFTVFDTSPYMDRPGWYCPGQDTVSQNIGIHGEWEPTDSAVIRRILEAGDRSRRVIDFGAHCGWYTIMAAKLGYDVLAIDGDRENIRLLRANIAAHDVAAKVRVVNVWVDEDFFIDTVHDTLRDVELVKIDLESHERHAVNAIWPCIDRVHNLYVEISPVFRPDYPALVDRLCGAGFRAFWPDDRPFDGDYSLGQFNLRFSR